MPETNTTHKAIRGFVITGNPYKSTVDEGEEFILAGEENRFGVGRRMYTVMDCNGKFIGYVTTGQAELIRMGEC